MADDASVASLAQGPPSPPPDGEERPLGLPAGSVRAIVAILLCAGVWVSILRGQEVPESFRDILLAVLGIYFARRGGAAGGPGTSRASAPLYLPRGSIRLVLLLGFAAVIACVLLRPIHVPVGNILLLALVGSFLAGQVVRRIAPRRGPLIEHLRSLKAAAVIVAAAVLAGSLLAGLGGLLPDPVPWICACAIGFYFGTR